MSDEERREELERRIDEASSRLAGALEEIDRRGQAVVETGRSIVKTGERITSASLDVFRKPAKAMALAGALALLASGALLVRRLTRPKRDLAFLGTRAEAALLAFRDPERLEPKSNHVGLFFSAATLAAYALYRARRAAR